MKHTHGHGHGHGHPPPRAGLAPGLPLQLLLPSQWGRRHTALAAVNTLLIFIVHRLLAITASTQVELFYIYYQPFAPFVAMLWLWGLNVAYFERTGVRYDACFSADDAKRLVPAAALFDIANVLSAVTLASAAAFLFNCARGAADAAALQPPLLYSAMLVILLLPLPTFYGDTRRFFATTAWRVVTPIRGVTWSDFLLADVLTSLAKGVSDIERAVCLMASGPVMAPAEAVCSDASWVIPAGLALPYAWRLVQCLRVHAETGARPQLWNALKYCTAFPVILLSAVKYHVPLTAWRGFYKPLWLAAALVNSLFSYYWDVERDWEIGFFSQLRARGLAGARPALAPALLYRRPFYLYLMVSNALLRLSWTYKLSPHLRRDHGMVFVIVLLEAVRRFQWIFVRVEVELRKIQAARPEVGQLVPVPSAAALGGASGATSANGSDWGSAGGEGELLLKKSKTSNGGKSDGGVVI